MIRIVKPGRSIIIGKLAPAASFFARLFRKPALSLDDPLIDPASLHHLLKNEQRRIRLVDARWFTPGAHRDPFAEFRREAIPGYFHGSLT